MFPFDIAGLKAEYQVQEKKTYENDFWDDVEAAQKMMAHLKQIKRKIDEYEGIERELGDLEAMLELMTEENEFGMMKEFEEGVSHTLKKLENFKLSTLLSGEFDFNDAIVSIHSGAGGLEAQDWAEMLLRMYRRWADQNDFKTEIMDMLSDTEGGIKSVTFSVRGDNAYGYLKSEMGVHRLVRISPFDAAKKRHTSFASVEVLPELEEDEEIEIDPNDLEINTYRATGAGGQHVNTTDSAVRITHLPTGITVQCQNERSQIMNRQVAMKVLMAKLIQLKEEEQKERIEDLKGDYNQIAWGHQIRSYVFQPYSLVKDHRTDAEMGDVYGVMDGDIDLFINEYLKMKAEEA
ncbi:MAG: peptide chain release factor 2 [Tissierellia bacterium]|nr:peptide chain release factor 2 [Tissierellia bacterium]